VKSWDEVWTVRTEGGEWIVKPVTYVAATDDGVHIIEIKNTDPNDLAPWHLELSVCVFPTLEKAEAFKEKHEPCTKHTAFPKGGRCRYCPECGAEGFPAVTYADGRMRCRECGLVCYIAEAEESHEEEKS
jgi:hypothetical protein